MANGIDPISANNVDPATGLRTGGFSPGWAYMQQQGTWPAGLGHTNFGQGFGLPLAPTNYNGVNFTQRYGSMSSPYADSGTQIQDAMQTPDRLQSSWAWNNGAPRYNFAQGRMGGLLNAGQGTPPQMPQVGNGFNPSSVQTPGVQTNMFPNAQNVPQAAPRPQASAPPANTGPGLLNPSGVVSAANPGQTQPQAVNNSALMGYATSPAQMQALTAKALAAGLSPQQAQAAVANATLDPADIAKWSALTSDTARGQFLASRPRLQNALHATGAITPQQIALYSELIQGGNSAYDPGYQGG